MERLERAAVITSLIDRLAKKGSLVWRNPHPENHVLFPGVCEGSNGISFHLVQVRPVFIHPKCPIGKSVFAPFGW